MASSESVQKRCAQARHFRFHVKPPILVSTSELYILRHNKPPDPTRSAPLPAMCDDCNTQNLHRNRMPAAASEAIAVVTRSLLMRSRVLCALSKRLSSHKAEVCASHM